jgi:hypothetical protein
MTSRCVALLAGALMVAAETVPTFSAPTIADLRRRLETAFAGT